MPIPASTNAVRAVAARSAVAARTIAHPATSKKNPASFMVRNRRGSSSIQVRPRLVAPAPLAVKPSPRAGTLAIDFFNHAQ